MWLSDSGSVANFYKAVEGAFNVTASDRTGDRIADYVQVSYSDSSHRWLSTFLLRPRDG